MKNYFDLFSIGTNFNIDRVKLKQAFNQQIIQFHPDKFITSSSDKRKNSMQNTNILNNAFLVLNDDLLRANYLLELNDINAFDEKDTTMNKDFLYKQIELQEQLDNINAENLAIFIEKIQNLIKINIENISHAFSENNLISVKNLVRELKFYTNLNNKAEQLLD